MAKKILLVEDEESIIQLLTVTFGDVSDYEILVARDGDMALQVAREKLPDIVLLDIGLPKINGIEVCRLLKSDPSLSRTKIIILSGMVQNSDRNQAQEAGADAFINKPFSLNTLTDEVENLLQDE